MTEIIHYREAKDINTFYYISFSLVVILIVPFIGYWYAYAEYFTNSISPICKSKYIDANSPDNYVNKLCYIPGIPYVVNNEKQYSINTLNNNTLKSSIEFHDLNISNVLKFKVKSEYIPATTYDNVAEPTFASNGTFIMYAANHFASTSKLNGKWAYLDPNFDFQIQTPSNMTNSTIGGENLISNFKADQHLEYDPIHKMYIWIRLGDFIKYSTGTPTNVIRLSLSKNGLDWIGYNFIASNVLKESHIREPFFDYPETLLSQKYLYLTTSVFDKYGNSYGLIMRIPLNKLSNSVDVFSYPITPNQSFNYDLFLDKNVSFISPVQGSANLIYFGTHIPNNNSAMKIYSWNEYSPHLLQTISSITPWNYVNNKKVCDKYHGYYWWCEANTSSRIRSAWFANNTINFLWNAIYSPDNGSRWIPYIDSATYNVNNCYSYERKYYLADNNTSWLFGSGTVNDAITGVIAFYTNMSIPNQNIHPFFNLAFGKFDDVENKWKMVKLLDSSSPLPVKDENEIDDYNIGDFLTLKSHYGNSDYNWDAAGYIIVGNNYYDVDPYLMMIK